jgi:hypothetical protein
LDCGGARRRFLIYDIQESSIATTPIALTATVLR